MDVMRTDSFSAVDLDMFQTFLAAFKCLSKLWLLIDSKTFLEFLQHFVYYWLSHLVFSYFLLVEHLAHLVFHRVRDPLAFNKFKILLGAKCKLLFRKLSTLIFLSILLRNNKWIIILFYYFVMIFPADKYLIHILYFCYIEQRLSKMGASTEF